MLRADSQDSLRNSKLVRLQNQISYLTLNYAAKRDWREAHHCSGVVDPLFQSEHGVLSQIPEERNVASLSIQIRKESERASIRIRGVESSGTDYFRNGREQYQDEEDEGNFPTKSPFYSVKS